MVSFSVPAAPDLNVFNVDSFLGVDLTSEPANVDTRRSPAAPNMIRDVPGKVRKCMGWHTMAQYGARINGRHILQGSPALLHAGGTVYREGTALRTDLADARSVSFRLGENLFVLDGETLWQYNGTTVTPARDDAYVPTLTIAKAAAGGGTEYEPLNLLTPRFRELFLAKSGETVFQLTFGGLDETPVRAWVLTAAGEWSEKTENTHFSVDRETGTVTFLTAPGVSPVTGEDNLKIEACRTVEGYAARVEHCRFGILYGVSGAADRLFLSGNPDWPNRDWYSGQYDGTYWPDTGYSVLGSEASAVVGYSVIAGKLAAHKDGCEPHRSILLREGQLQESVPAFPIVNTLQGPGAVAPFSFGYLCAEPLFLTRLGVYSVTASDTTGERYAQNRSWYLDGALLAESGPEEAFGFVWRDLYWLCLNGKAYILDGLQPQATAAGAPYSTRQYAGFVRSNLPARVLWEQDGALWFGTADGRVCTFYTDRQAAASYADDGVPVEAAWETPDLSGKLFYKNKSLRRLSLRLVPAASTGVSVWAQLAGQWRELLADRARARYFDWNNLNWAKWSWSGDTTPRLLGCRLRLHRRDKLRLRFENREAAPFALQDWALEYTQNGNFRV